MVWLADCCGNLNFSGGDFLLLPNDFGTNFGLFGLWCFDGTSRYYRRYPYSVATVLLYQHMDFVQAIHIRKLNKS